MKSQILKIVSKNTTNNIHTNNKHHKRHHLNQDQIQSPPSLASKSTTTPLKTRLILIATLLGLVLMSLMAARPTFALPTQVQQHQQQQHNQGSQLQSQSESPKGVFKRSFAGLGCLGVYDKGKFARLDRVCEECYQLYREPDIHQACRQDCFRNQVFGGCVDALLLSHESKKFDEMVDELYGK